MTARNFSNVDSSALAAHPKRRTAATLMEVILVTVLLAVVATSIVIYVRQPAEKVRDAACDAEIANLQLLVQQFQKDVGRLPSPNLNQLRDDRYLGKPIPVCPADGQPYRLRRSTGEIIPHTH